MRRALSSFLILFFGLGPVAATLHAEDDAGLPACCRRNGAHHCNLSARMVAMMVDSDGKTSLSAPTACPYFPGYNVAPSTTPLALGAQPVSMPALLVQPHTPAAARAAARLSQLRTRAGRGPPDSSHS
jgi:hypothetical protein